MTNNGTLADVLGITAKLTKTMPNSDITLTMDVKQGANNIGSLSANPGANLLDGTYASKKLFSFNISDGNNTATVDVTYGDIIDFGSITTPDRYSATVDGQDLESGEARAKSVPATANNLGALADKINDVAQTSSLGLEASYSTSTGEFSITSNSETPIINVGSVDIVSHLNLV